MTIATNIVAGLLALAFAFFGASKVGASEAQVAMFQGWGYPLWFMYVVGAAELSAAVLLVLPGGRFYGASLVVGLMVGALATHAVAGELMQLPLPMMTGAAAGLVAVLSRPPWLANLSIDSHASQAGDSA